MHKASMSATAAGKAVVELDADDQAMYERFVAANATTRYEWPDQKERSGKSGKADVKRRRKNRDARNLTSIDDIEAVAAAQSRPKETAVPRPARRVGRARTPRRRRASGFKIATGFPGLPLK